MTEKQIQNAILKKYGTDPRLRLWRNNVGVAVDIATVQKLYRAAISLNIKAVRDIYRRRRAVKYGIPGQADLSGILPDGRRLEIEVKSETGKQSEDQKRFERMIRQMNGVYILARSVEDVGENLKEML